MVVMCNNRLYTFGGMRGQLWNSDLYYYDCRRESLDKSADNNQWVLVKTLGEVPGPRLDFSMVAYRNQIIIFGGGKDSKFNNDTYALALTTNVWKKITINSSVMPAPRQGHSSVLCENELLILGGWIGGYTMLNDLWALNLDTYWWRKIEMLPGPTNPPPFYANKMFVHRSSLVVFGGHNGARHLDDLYQFDLDAKMWSTIKHSGEVPSARGLYGATIFGNRMLVTCGNNSELGKFSDLYSLNLDNWTWTRVKLRGDIPMPRFSPAVEIKGNDMILFGGRNNVHYFNDLYLIPLEIRC